MKSIFNKKSKKGAIELSMTTVVIIVLAMTMLILGLTLVKTIFTGAKYNVETINEKVKGEINKLFVEEEQRSAIYLASASAKIKQGESYGIAFAIKNVEDEGMFSYDVKKISDNCKIDDPMKWFLLAPSGSKIPIAAGSVYTDRILLKPSPTAELCTAKFRIEISKDGRIYDTPLFIVEIKGKGII